MANHRMDILSSNLLPEPGVYQVRVGNQISAATAPSVGEQMAWVIADGGSDLGFYADFKVPEEYVGTPVIVITGILDGAPSNGDDLGFGFRDRAVADNEAADGTYNAEMKVQNTDIGGTGDNYSDEDVIVLEITVTTSYTVGDKVFYYFYINADETTYTGNFLLTDLELKFADA